MVSFTYKEMPRRFRRIDRTLTICVQQAMIYFQEQGYNWKDSKLQVSKCLDICSKTVAKILQSADQLAQAENLSRRCTRKYSKTRVPSNLLPHIRKVMIHLKQRHKEVSVRSLHDALQQQSSPVWKWGKSTLYTFLLEHGFRYGLKHKHFKGVFDNALQQQRQEFQQMIRSYDSKGFRIFYGDETMMHNNLVSRSEWTDGSRELSSLRKFMTRNTWKVGICCLGSKHGILHPATMFYDLNKHSPTRARTHPRWNVDFRGNMNGDQYLEWWIGKALPSLPSNSVVILDNASYHKKKDKSGEFQIVTHARRLRKDVTVLYLPPYSPDLNPIEMMWSDMKQYVRKNSVDTVDPSMYQCLILQYFRKKHQKFWKSLVEHCLTIKE